MGKNRLETFSDGVIAIIITIMVLEMKVPHGVSIESLTPVIPVFLSYVLSFTYLGIHWSNHHHMLYVLQKVSGPILWANLHLLFWLSLIPFATAWMGENHFAAMPTALYGVALLMPAIAYVVLQHLIIAVQGPDSVLRSNRKRLERQSVDNPLCNCDTDSFLVTLGIAEYLRRGCDCSGLSGSTHRERHLCARSMILQNATVRT